MTESQAAAGTGTAMTTTATAVGTSNSTSTIATAQTTTKPTAVASNNNNNGKLFTQDMSPLDMLEQNSRRLADRLHHTSLDDKPHHNQHHNQSHRPATTQQKRTDYYPQNALRGPPQPQALPPHQPRAVDRHPTPPQSQSQSQPQFQQPLQQQFTMEDENGEWRPDSRASYVSRTQSIASVSSLGGGILDSFRLSTLPGLSDAMMNNSPSARSSIMTFRTNDNYDYGNNQRSMGVDDIDDDDDDSDTATIQEPSPIEPNDSASVRMTREVQQEQLQQKKPSPLQLDTNYQDGGLLSPTNSINSDNSSVYTAASHFSYSSQLQPQAQPRKSFNQQRSTTSPKSPSTNQPYFFPDALKQQSHQQKPRSNSNGLMLPPTLRSSSNGSNGSLNSSPNLGHTKDDERAVTNKLFKDMTMDEHVTTGISLHEHGNLREASYHWQYAAFKGEHTAMLLYGLALRHGWGIRKNPTEAIKWLRSAMESSIGEFSSSGSNQPGSRASKISNIRIPEGDGSSLKKAHIGLALYELGMSYLHSWGTEKDEEMALKSFEMAGSLGDADALCEAAALYTKNGPKGRKKDLQKAARLYREAGEKGANMVGQSWIYKDKYMPAEEKDKKKNKKKK